LLVLTVLFHAIHRLIFEQLDAALVLCQRAPLEIPSDGPEAPDAAIDRVMGVVPVP
jgi:hypothetical protein